MDTRTAEERRQATLNILDMVEARTRTATAKTLLHILAIHRRDITPEDAHNTAYAYWAEFVGDGGRNLTDEMHAEVLARLITFLDEATIHRIARDTFGDRPVDTNGGSGHVQWIPSDDTLFITGVDMLTRIYCPMAVGA